MASAPRTAPSRNVLQLLRQLAFPKASDGSSSLTARCICAHSAPPPARRFQSHAALLAEEDAPIPDANPPLESNNSSATVATVDTTRGSPPNIHYLLHPPVPANAAKVKGEPMRTRELQPVSRNPISSFADFFGEDFPGMSMENLAEGRQEAAVNISDRVLKSTMGRCLERLYADDLTGAFQVVLGAVQELKGHTNVSPRKRLDVVAAGELVMQAFNKIFQYSRTRYTYQILRGSGLLHASTNDYPIRARMLFESTLNLYLEALLHAIPKSTPISILVKEAVEEFAGKHVRLSERPYDIIIMAMVRETRLEEAEGLVRYWLRTKREIVSPIKFTAILRGWLKLQADFSQLMRVYNWMREENIQPNSNTYSVLVEAAILQGHTDALEALLPEMQEKGLANDTKILAGLACAQIKLKDWEGLKKTLLQMSEKGLELPTPLLAVLVDISASVRGFDYCEEMLETIMRKGGTIGKAVYDSMIRACLRTGNVEKCGEWLRRMKDAGHTPDSHTAKKLFEYLIDSNKFSPHSLRRLYYQLSRINRNLVSEQHRLELQKKLMQRRPPKNVLRMFKIGRAPNPALVAAQMLSFIKLKVPQLALQAFNNMVRDGITPSKHIFLLALRAAFSLPESPTFRTAREVLFIAKQRKFPIPRDVVTDIFRLAREKQLAEESLITGIPRTVWQEAASEGEPAAIAWIIETHLKMKNPRAAVQMVVEYLPKSKDWNAKSVLVIMTQAIRAFYQVRSIGGVEWVLSIMMERRICPDMRLRNYILKDHPKDWETEKMATLKERVESYVFEVRVEAARHAERWLEEFESHRTGPLLEKPNGAEGS